MRLIFILILVLAVGFSFYQWGRPLWVPVYQKVVGKRTVDDVLKRYGDKAKQRLLPNFKEAGITYPPKKIKLLALKEEAQLELWATNDQGYKQIKTYDIQAASGVMGPKLREGDLQVPEGVYQLEYLNPNSSYHLSMKINYPNAFDLQHAKAEGRTKPGTNIFIHGKAVSIGCLAMGDKTIEELFTLVATIGRKNVEVIIAPTDPRKHDILPFAKNQPDWVTTLYKQIDQVFKESVREK